MSEETYKAKAKENIVRGFIHLLPKGEAIDKILFSLKDARESEEIEMIYSFIETKLDKLLLNQLKEAKEVDNISFVLKEKLGDINEVVSQFNVYIYNQIEFNKKIKILIDESRDILLDQFKDVKDKLDVLLSINEKTISTSDKEIITSLFRSLFKSFSKKLQDLKYDDVLTSIESIKKLSGLKNVDQLLQDELSSFEAEVHLKLSEINKADEITKRIIKNNNLSLRICEYLLYYSTFKKDKKLFDDIMNNYKLMGVVKKKIIMKEVFWHYYDKNYSRVLELLCKDSSHSEINKDFTDSPDSYFFAGMSLFEMRNYELAKKYLAISYEKEKSILHKYYLILNDAFKIIDRKSAIILITESEKESLIKHLNELSSEPFEEYFRNAPLQLLTEYWIQRISISLHIDRKTALDQYENCPTELKNDLKIKSIYADVLYFNEKFQEANQILLELFSESNNYNYITKILSSYLEIGKYEDILTFSEKIKDYDPEGIIYSLIIEAYAKLNDLEDVIMFASDKIEKCKYPIYIYRSLGDLFFETNDLQKANDYYNKMVETIPSDNYPPRIIFARHLRSKNEIALCLRCLEPFLPFNYEAQKLYVYDAVRPGNEKYYAKADELIDYHINENTDSSYWLGNKVELEFNRMRYNTAHKYLEELYTLDDDINVAYKLAHTKILLGRKDIVELAIKLERDQRPYVIMMAANCYFVLGDYEKAEKLSLKSIAYHGDNFNENLFAQYLRINIGPKPGIKDIAEIEEVDNDCTVLLESESEQKWIGITSKPELLVKENQYKFADTIFYFRNDEKVIHLIGSKKNDSVVFNKENCVIKDIWKVKTKVVRHFMFEYTSKLPDSKFLKLVKIDESKPLESMMPILVEGEIYDKQTLEDYNFRNKLGLPLHQIALRKGRNLVDAILYILEKPNQLFYTGEINLLDLKNSKILLSPTSVICLSLLDILDTFIIKFKEKILVSKNTRQYFVDIVDKLNTEEFGISMSIGIDNGNYFATDYTKEQIKKRQSFYYSIIKSLSDVSAVSITISAEELDDKSKYIDLISVLDYENLKYASEHDLVYLLDDLLVRKARGLFKNNIDIMNSASILYYLFEEDIPILLEKLEIFSKGGYNYLFNLESLKQITKALFDKYHLIGKDSQYDIFLKIIHNALSNKIVFVDYFKIIVKYLDFLYYYNSDKRAIYLIQVLLKELWSLISLYNLHPNIMFSEIEVICKNDNDKISFFYDMLREIN